MIEAYSSPMSVTAGETIELRISSSADVEVLMRRLNPVDAVPPGEPVWGPVRVAGHVQAVPPDAAAFGCRWQPSYTFAVPAHWRSGVYSAQCTNLGDGGVTHVVFVVKPPAGRRADVAALVNLNTWNAYNGWGGGSKYDGAVRGSFDRPFRTVSNPVPDGNVNHTALAELWVLNWLERWYSVDTYADPDLHAGMAPLSDYRALVLSTHPEYWSHTMLDRLHDYLAAGGHLLYLAGNGLFELCDYTADRSALLFWNGDSTQPRERNFLRNLVPPRPERELLGVAYRFNNYLTRCKAAPLAVIDASHRFFRGTVRAGGGELVNGDLIGATGRNRYAGQDPSFGAASGWETDTSRGASAPPGVIVNGWEPGRPTYDMDANHVITATAAPGTDRGEPPANLQLLARGTNDSAEGQQAADMTCYDHAGGGFVFAAGSINFGGSLVEDANLQQIVLNVLDDALGWVDPFGTAYSAIWVHENGPAWQARHGLTAQQHQQVFDDLTGQGYRQTAVSGYAVGNDARFASVWVQSGGPAWQARHGLSADEHQQTFDQLAAQGYRLSAISGYAQGGEARYASIWQQADGPAWQARHGLTAEQHQQTFDALAAQGYRLTAISSYTVNGTVLYASVWVQAGGPDWQARHGLDADQHQQTFHELTARGYRLTAISSCAVAGGLRFASIWEQSHGPAWQARHGITAARYQREFNLLARAGYRLVAVSGASHGND